MSVFFLIFWSPTVNPLNNSPDQWVNACMCKGYSHFSEEHVVGVIGGGKSLQVSLQLQQLPLHLPEALFQILCRHWNTSTYIKTHKHTHTVYLQKHTEKHPRAKEIWRKKQKKDNSITGKIKCIIISRLWRRSREKQYEKKLENEREASSLSTRAYYGLTMCQKHQGINNDWGKNNHQVRVRTIHSRIIGKKSVCK